MKTLDKIGFWASFVCLIHCIAMPFLVTIMPLFTRLDSTFELILLSTGFVVGSVSLINSIIKHKEWIPFFIFSIGIMCILDTRFFPNEINEKSFKAYAALLSFMLAHILNWRLTQNQDGKHPHQCEH